MKCAYCANCGTRLAITKKAIPGCGKIINIVEHHECPDEPVEFDLTPIEIPTFDVLAEKGGNKFVQNLNKLQSQSPTIEPGDRRDIADIKKGSPSTAPRTLLDTVKVMHNTTPVNDMSNEPPTGE